MKPALGIADVRVEDDLLTLPEDDGHRAAPLLRRSFRLEDFLWSGSGDGPDEGASLPHVTTVFRTTTIVTTVYHTPTPHISWTTCSESCLSSPTIEPSETLDVSPSVTIEDAPTPSLHRTFPPEATPSVEVPTPTPTLYVPSPTKAILPPSHIEPTTPYPPDILPQYWLLTVVRGNEAEEPVPSVMASRLARLYKKAFIRQQERHLGILKPTIPTPRREDGGMSLTGWRKPRALDPVLVRMIKVSVKEDEGPSKEDVEGSDVEMLYSVHVGNRPVLAKTAAEDMKLISKEEASKELGFPVVTKAEPYLKDAGRSMSSNGVWRSEAWAVVVVAIAVGFLILLVLIAFIAKRQRKKRQRRLVSGAESADVTSARPSEGGLGAANRRQVFESGACTNLAYEGAESDPDVKLSVGPSGQAKGHTWVPKQLDVFPEPSAPRHSEPMEQGPRRHLRPSQKQHPGEEEDDEEEEAMEEVKRRYVREKSTTKRRKRPSQMHPALRLEDPLPRNRPPSPQEDFMGSEGEWTPVPLHKSMASPTSYLSMPSVRAFPKGANIPEPLALVLEGNRHPAARDSVSVRHLDIYPEASAFEPHRKGDYARHSRHGSFDEDPGVLGPKVFEVVRRERELRRQSSLLIGGSRRRLPEDNIILPLGEGARLRKRFHDLLDDTLLLFGRRYGEQSKTEKRKEPDSGVHQLHPGYPRVDFRSQSAYTRAEEPLLGYLDRPPRPKTSMSRPITADVGSHAWSAGQRRGRVASAGPRGAWGPTDSVNSPASSGRVSSTISLFTRPVSAGPFHSVTPISPSIQHDSPPPPAPTVDTNLVLVDAQMPASDPAIPLIQAIKAELRKFHPHDTPS